MIPVPKLAADTMTRHGTVALDPTMKEPYRAVSPAHGRLMECDRWSCLHTAIRLTALSVITFGCGGQARPSFRDPSSRVEARVQDLLAQMTPEEKFWQLFAVPDTFGADHARFRPGIFGLQIRAGTRPAEMATRINEAQQFFRRESRLGIPIIPFEEALHGVVAPGATVFPQAIALAATWDTALVGRVAAAIAAEARGLGVRQVLSPVLNIATDVRWGRVEETYGEDPWLVTAMGTAFLRPFAAAGVVTTPKHFVANVGDGGRDSYPVDLSERFLREVHFPPFRAAVQEGGAQSVMASYNSVHGLPATANPWLLTEVLRKEWGFAGYVIGDAGATGGANVLHGTSRDYTESTAEAVNAGLDVIFQSGWEQHQLFQEAFTRGNISSSRMDEAVSRVLRTKFALGLFEDPFVDTAAAAREIGSAAHRADALDAARAALTLLRNEAGTLPLRATTGSIAVIGPDATEHRFGGYSGTGRAPVSILDGIRTTAGSSFRVTYAPGPGREASGATTIPPAGFGSGLRGEYFANTTLAGTPLVTRQDARLDFNWAITPPDSLLSADWYSVRWTGSLTTPPGAPVRIGVEGNDGYRLYLDDALVLDRWRKETAGRRMAAVTLTARRTYRLRLEYYESTGNGRIRLLWDDGQRDGWRSLIAEAARRARGSTLAVVTVGLEEGEFRDRSSLALPGHQEELIDAVASTGVPTVVVIVGGSAVTMPWLERAGAVLLAWYPGEVGGSAVAEALFGDINPSGRLPITFPRTEGQLPLVYNHKPTGRGNDYLNASGQGLFPFGFGLSYSTFEYSGLRIEPGRVRFRIRNAGPLPGAEVPQLYLRDELASVARPVMALAGFARVVLAVGEEREVAFPVTQAQLGLLDARNRWVIEPGDVRVMVGASSRDIRLRGILTVR